MPVPEDHISIEIMYYTLYKSSARVPFVAFILSEITTEPITDARRQDLALEAASFIGHKDTEIHKNLADAQAWFKREIDLLRKGSAASSKFGTMHEYENNLRLLDSMQNNPGNATDAAGSKSTEPSAKRPRRT